MSDYVIPVSWTVTSTVKVTGAPSLQAAVSFLEDRLDDIPCSPEAEYVDGSYAIDISAKECPEEHFPKYRHFGNVEVSFREEPLEALKKELLANGEEAIEDFLGFPLETVEAELSDEDISQMIGDVAVQMPDSVLEMYYDRYKIRR